MECYLIDNAGRSFALPVLTDWSFSYGCTLPCDSFEICFLYEKAMLGMLENAVRFKAVFEGDTVFFGVVDEFEVSISEKGSVVFVRGRGLAALLLDNEVEAAEYLSAGLDLVLDRYVHPFGISKVERIVSPPKMPLSVDSGASAWRVLEDYLWFGCSVKPRFSKDGVLLLGKRPGKRLSLSGRSAVTVHEMKRKRYGVVSEVLVRNKVLGRTTAVKNEGFLEKGGCCRRVINVPRYTRFDAMRSTGEYQIEGSKAKELSLTVRLPSLFAAFPGDVLELYDSPIGISGTFFVGETTCFGNGEGTGTVIVLTRREA